MSFGKLLVIREPLVIYLKKQQVNERERGADKCESALLKILYYCSKTFVSLHCTLSVPFISLLQLLIALSFLCLFLF